MKFTHVTELTDVSFNAAEIYWRNNCISDALFLQYKEMWAFAGEWYKGKYCFYHVSDFAERLREQVMYSKQLTLPIQMEDYYL